MSRTIVTRPKRSKPAMDFDAMGAKATEAAALLGTMAHPMRLLILCALVEAEMSVSELVKRCGISQSAVSQHLAKMRDLKLVTPRRAGQTIYYRLASDEVRRILARMYEIYCTA